MLVLQPATDASCPCPDASQALAMARAFRLLSFGSCLGVAFLAACVLLNPCIQFSAMRRCDQAYPCGSFGDLGEKRALSALKPWYRTELPGVLTTPRLGSLTSLSVFVFPRGYRNGGKCQQPGPLQQYNKPPNSLSVVSVSLLQCISGIPLLRVRDRSGRLLWMAFMMQLLPLHHVAWCAYSATSMGITRTSSFIARSAFCHSPWLASDQLKGPACSSRNR
ncbi:uncharacterized protein LOC119807963 [Arvicola amphibius]|uniref:uncharacterized protein LOC119807963 n=1 Tax=Arvicola amphibius TaxID=1047088 RepID=UPI0018E391FC|nr:uncharacterized protein LOC119807963 [Arvicola amphibius]